MTSTQSGSAYEFTSDKQLINVEVVHGYLTRSYWSPGVPLEVVKRAIEGSLCFGVLHQSSQIAFARVVTDKATFAYLADVFVLEPHRGMGLSKKLLAYIFSHAELQGLRRFMLATRDAHDLYKQFGFTELLNPARFMELHRPDVYHASPRLHGN